MLELRESGKQEVINMQMTMTTPGLLFPAISLLLLAYTNRFVVLTNVIRRLSGDLDGTESEVLIRRQISMLRRRLNIIRSMQSFAVLSFVVCTLSMFGLFLGWLIVGQILFGVSLLMLVTSLLLSLWEVQLSTVAITIELEKLNSH